MKQRLVALETQRMVEDATWPEKIRQLLRQMDIATIGFAVDD
jgi:hypothetical protein